MEGERMSDAEKVHWYLDDYLDEVLVHEPTLEGAAYFLQHGKRDDESPREEYFSEMDLPLKGPGSIVALSALTELFDAIATRRVLDDGTCIWEFSPMIPADADFMAVRYGEGQSWDGETIMDPQDPNLSAALEEIYGEDDAFIEHVVIGRHSDHRARFEIVEGRGVLSDVVTVRACRLCGCTDDRACVTEGVACHWAEPDLCSACVEN